MNEFLLEVERAAGASLSACYGCGRCSNTCPVVEHMDIPPAAMIRAIIHGRREAALSSKTIWVCTSCHACSTRCPFKIDFPAVVDALRAIAAREKRRGVADVRLYHEMFVEELRARGRVREITFRPRYRARSSRSFTDADLALAMFLKGRFPLLPARVKDMRAVREALGGQADGRQGP